LTVAVIVFVPAVVDAIAPVATPAASVVAAGCVRVLFAPVAASWTVWPATGFPFASRTVTVIVEVVVPFATTFVVGFAVAVVSAGSIVEGSPTKPTVGCCWTMTWLAPGLTVAVIVFVPALVDAIVPVATPAASVVVAGCVSVLFVPVAPSWTVCPGTGFPFASTTVTVIVARSSPLATTPADGTTATVERPALIVPGLAEKVTLACWRMATWFAPGFTVAETVFVSATVDASVPMAKPAASVTVGGCVSVLPVPVAASCTVCPGTGFPFASKTWTVIVATVTPSAARPPGGVALTVDSVALIVLASAMKPTVGCCVTATWLAPGLIVALIVFDSAIVEVIVPVVAPVASVVAAGWVRTWFVPVLASWTVWPGIGFPCTSRTVTVIVEESEPSATTSSAGFAPAVDRVPSIALASPMKPTVGCWTTTTWEGPGLIVAVIVFVSASVDAIVPVVAPDESVVAAGCVSVLLDPVEFRATDWPATGFPKASATVTVIVDVSRSFATTPVAGVAAAAERVALIVLGSPRKVTVSVAVSWTEPAPTVTIAPTTFASACVEARKPTVVPVASVGVAGWTRRFPSPVASSTTTRPGIGLPRVSKTVTTTGAASVPFAILVPAGCTTTVEAFASTVGRRPPPPPPLQALEKPAAVTARANVAPRREVGSVWVSARKRSRRARPMVMMEFRVGRRNAGASNDSAGRDERPPMGRSFEPVSGIP
jgi:hypothetical protein